MRPRTRDFLFFFLLILIFTLVACSEKEYRQTTTTTLEGVWDICFVVENNSSEHRVLTFTENAYQIIDKGYSDDACQVSSEAVRTESGTFVIGDSFTTAQGLSVTEIDFMTLKVNDSSVNEFEYNIFSITDGNQLTFGDAASGNGTAEDKRPTDLDLEFWLDKVGNEESVVAQNDKVSIQIGSEGISINVLSNDKLLDGTGDVTITDLPTHGLATVSADNTIAYILNADSTLDNGNYQDIFAYTVTGTGGDSDTAEVSVSIFSLKGCYARKVEKPPSLPIYWYFSEYTWCFKDNRFAYWNILEIISPDLPPYIKKDTQEVSPGKFQINDSNIRLIYDDGRNEIKSFSFKNQIDILIDGRTYRHESYLPIRG